jgi:hypothetical protein
MRIYDIDASENKKDIAVFAIGDIQYGDDMCSVSRLEEYLDWTMYRYHDCTRIFIGVGDYIDLASPSNRSLVAELYESPRAALTLQGRKWIKELYSILAPRLVSTNGILLHGHHYCPYHGPEGGGYEDSDEELADLLGYQACDTWKALVSVDLGDDQRVKILASHGNKGGGQLAGSYFNMLEKQANRFDDIDIIVQGHANRIGAIPVPRLREVGGEFKDRHIHMLACGSFSKSLSNDGETYAERADYPPLGIGHTAVRISRKAGRPVLESTVRT